MNKVIAYAVGIYLAIGAIGAVVFGMLEIHQQMISGIVAGGSVAGAAVLLSNAVRRGWPVSELCPQSSTARDAAGRSRADREAA
jgi:hypothetical protein